MTKTNDKGSICIQRVSVINEYQPWAVPLFWGSLKIKYAIRQYQSREKAASPHYSNRSVLLHGMSWEVGDAPIWSDTASAALLSFAWVWEFVSFCINGFASRCTMSMLFIEVWADMACIWMVFFSDIKYWQGKLFFLHWSTINCVSLHDLLKFLMLFLLAFVLGCPNTIALLITEWMVKSFSWRRSNSMIESLWEVVQSQKLHRFWSRSVFASGGTSFFVDSCGTLWFFRNRFFTVFIIAAGFSRSKSKW